MPRAKPARWSLPTTKELKIDDAWSRDELMALIDRHLKSGSQKRAKELFANVYDTLGFFKVELHNRTKPTEGRVKTALQRIESATAEVVRLLDIVDDESRRRLGAAANEDPVWTQENPSSDPLSCSTHALERLQTWTKGALQSIGESQAGAKNLQAERDAILGLLNAWGKACHNRADLKYPPKKGGDFDTFVQNALEPIRAKYGDESGRSLSAIISEVLEYAPPAPIPCFAKPEK